MSSYFNFTVVSRFLGNVLVKPHSKHSAPPGCNRVKVSQILGPTAVAPVAPVDTSLIVQGAIRCKTGKEGIKLAYGSRNKIRYTRCAAGVTQCLSLRAGKYLAHVIEQPNF